MPQARETNQGNERTYICDFSRGVLNVRPTLTSNTCSEATNIGSFIPLILSLAVEVRLEFHVGGFGDSPEGCDFLGNLGEAPDNYSFACNLSDILSLPSYSSNFSK